MIRTLVCTTASTAVDEQATSKQTNKDERHTFLCALRPALTPNDLTDHDRPLDLLMVGDLP